MLLAMQLPHIAHSIFFTDYTFYHGTGSQPDQRRVISFAVPPERIGRLCRKRSRQRHVADRHDPPGG
jgi:hypothetical protein